jgi:hypothetical protein
LKVKTKKNILFESKIRKPTVMPTHVNNPLRSGRATHYQNVAGPNQIARQCFDRAIDTDVATPSEEYVEKVGCLPIDYANFTNMWEVIKYAVNEGKSPPAAILRDDVCKPRARLVGFVNLALYNRI